MLGFGFGNGEQHARKTFAVYRALDFRGGIGGALGFFRVGVHSWFSTVRGFYGVVRADRDIRVGHCGSWCGAIMTPLARMGNRKC